MFDKFGNAAERLATNASRRAFLGRLGKRALALAGLFGFAASTAEANPTWFCCSYYSWPGGYTLCSQNNCPKKYLGVPLSSSWQVPNCESCG